MDKLHSFGPNPGVINFFDNLAFIFGVRADSEHILRIPAKTGTGIIRKFEIANDIELIFFDFYLRQKIVLKRIMASPAEERSLSAIAILTPRGLAINKKDFEGSDNERDIPTIVFTSAANELDFIILPDHIIKAVIINFRMDGLEREAKDANLQLVNNLKDLFVQKNYFHFREQASASIYHQLIELHGHATRNHSDKTIVKSQTISVLFDMIREVLSKHKDEEANNLLLYAKMESVKKMLEEYVEKKLPPIPVIAKEVAISESTLKRNFKQVFGTSIYDYYLQIKMERARQLFAEKPFSVKEVAFKLGYEKTSSFIKIFKKFYNFSPGELKKKYSGFNFYSE